MNELNAVLSFTILAAIVLVSARFGKVALFVLSSCFILLSNISVQVPAQVFGVEISWAIIIYSLVYFINDIVCEYHGREAGYKLAATNLIVQVIMWGYVWSVINLIPVDSGKNIQQVVRDLFGTTSQITFAAIVASIGPFMDVYIFERIRSAWDRTAIIYKDSGSFIGVALNHKIFSIVIRNKLSTFGGQIVNTIIFFGLALYGTEISNETIMSIIISASVVKIVIAVFDIPFLIAASKMFGKSGNSISIYDEN